MIFVFFKELIMEDFLFYLTLGWEHIISLDALDHQLFLLALVVGYRFNDSKKLLILITAFTIGHSVTLALSVLDWIRIPSTWVEFLIPLTIVLTALENLIFRERTKKNRTANYTLALFFGLIHGMAFANLARVLISEEQNITIPLLGFNVGLELGQIIVLILFFIVSFIFVNLIKVNRKDWALMISSGVFALALKMTLEIIP